MNPFRLDGPTCVSFSGGRTSAYMLRRILDAHGGAMPEDAHVLFANTGKERLETLDFVHECETRWNVRVRWLEAEITHGNAGKLRHGFREASYATASRNGEPFEAMIRARSFLPNPVMRACTTELKIRPMKAFAMSVGFDHWTNAIGLRADEPRRVAKTTAPTVDRWENACPLAAAGVTLADVSAFWSASPFDLQLQPHEGNCDLCFLKGRSKIDRLIRARPQLADWWISMEALPFGKGTDARFRHDRPSYAAMRDRIERTPLLPMFDDEDALPCACTD